MAASKSVLGCLKTGALADCLIAPFFLTAPLPEKFSSPRALPLIFFISARITSRAACPADVRGLRWPRFNLRFDLRAAGFMEDNSFCQETLPQMVNRAVRRSLHGLSPYSVRLERISARDRARLSGLFLFARRHAKARTARHNKKNTA